MADCDEDIFDEPINFDRLTDYVKESSHIMLVALSDGSVIGQLMAVIHRHPDKPTDLYVDELAVAEDYRRRVIATRLMEAVLLMGVERGCEEVWLAVEPENEGAKQFYGTLNLHMSESLIFEKNCKM